MIDREYFAGLVRQRDEEIDLGLAALAIATIVEPISDHQRFIRILDADADWLRLRFDPSADLEQTVRRLCHYLAHDRGFHGNERDYYNPRNSCLNYVLTNKAGLPISLSVIYMEVGRRLGLDLVGVGLPGHFVIKFLSGDSEIIVDPFYQGIVLDRAELTERLRRQFGRPLTLEDHDFDAVTRRQILVRMLLNLRHIYLRQPLPDFARALAAIEYSLLLRPSSLDDVRDRGLVRRHLGQVDLAMDDLQTYLTYATDAPDARRIEQQLVSLRRQLPPGRQRDDAEHSGT